MAEIESTQAHPMKATTNVLYLLHLLAPFTAWLLAVVAIVIGIVTWTILFIWYLYRVIRGWLLLSDGKTALGFP